MTKLKFTLLLFTVITLTSFTNVKKDIDDIVVKIIKMDYGPMINGQQVWIEKGMIYHSIGVSLTNTGTSDYNLDLTRSYLTDKDNNIWYLTSPWLKKVVIKSGKKKVLRLYYKFPEDEDPQYIILGDKVFEAKEDKSK